MKTWMVICCREGSFLQVRIPRQDLLWGSLIGSLSKNVLRTYMNNKIRYSFSQIKVKIDEIYYTGVQASTLTTIQQPVHLSAISVYV